MDLLLWSGVHIWEVSANVVDLRHGHNTYDIQLFKGVQIYNPKSLINRNNKTKENCDSLRMYKKNRVK